MSTLALVLADIRHACLSILTQNRAEPAVPFAGKYRIIDFVLSNCANSGIRNIGILTQYHPHSLNDHIGSGRPWDLDRTWSGSVTLLPPYRRSNGSGNWYVGTADAVYQNLDFVQEQKADTVLLLPGEHVYKMDYDPLVRYHKELQADVTICAINVPQVNWLKGDYLVVDSTGCVIGINDTPLWSPYPLVSMGIYVFQTDVLMQRLTHETRAFSSRQDLGKDVLPRMLQAGDRLCAYPFDGYWVNVDSVQAYWEANMDLLQADPPLKLQDTDWCIYTRSEERPPVTISTDASVSNSLITDGCTIQGRVEKSVLSAGVRVRSGAVVRDCIVFSDCDIGAGAVVDRAILDKNVVVGEKACVGYGVDSALNRREIDDSNSSIMVVGRDTHLPPRFRVDADSTIDSDPLRDLVSRDFVVSSQRNGLRDSQVISKFMLVPQRQWGAWRATVAD